MRIIYFKENEKEIWNEFITENSSESFLQSWEWGEFNRVLRRKVWRIVVVEDGLADENKTKVSSIKYQVSSDNLIAVALIVKHDLPFGRNYLYCPRGPVMEKRKTKNEKRKIIDLLFNEVKKIAEKEKSLFLRIDPPVNWNMEYGIWNMEDNGFVKSPNEIQPRDTLMLDITKSEYELLKEMKQKTRYNIKLAERKELRIRNWEIGRLRNLENLKKDFEKFCEIMKETSKRGSFRSHNEDYYWKMLESCCGERKFSFSAKQNNDLIAKLYLAEYENKIIAASIVLYFGDLAIYLHGASSSGYKSLMAPYLLQWRQIMDAKNAGCKKYDFWGIAQECQMSNVKCQMKSKSKNSWGGITRFKKGFGGFEKNYIGAYDLVFNNIGYAMYKFVKFVKF